MTGRNPPWQRDELILALDLYFRRRPSIPGPTDPEVVALSELLNALPIHAVRPDAARFRNPNGVSSKLSNFLPHDPSYRGKGRDHGNHLDGEVYAEFADRPEELARLAAAIRVGSGIPDAEPNPGGPDADEDAFPEGRVIYRIHRARERNAALVRRAKHRALATVGTLTCAVCGFDFSTVYGSVGDGYIECHHTRPLSELANHQVTRLDEVVLVCSNCHRMIHRRRPWLGVADLAAVLARHDRR